MERPHPEPEPYPDFDFKVAQIKAHAEGLTPEERHIYLEMLCEKRRRDDKEDEAEWEEILLQQRSLEATLIDELFFGPTFVPNGALDEAEKAADFEDLEEYIERVHDRDEQIRILQADAQEDLEEYLYSRRLNQLSRGHIDSFDEHGDDLLVDLLDGEIDTHREFKRALELDEPRIITQLCGGRRGPDPRHNHENLWERSVTACLRILKSRRDCVEPVDDEKLTVSDFTKEMRPAISKATWYRRAKLASKPDGTPGITREGVIEEAYARYSLEEETPED